MKAAILVGRRKIDIRDVPKPAVGHGEVLVHMKAVGVCGTDMHIYNDEHPNVKLPRIMGHEAAGEVVALGNESEGFYEGDRVVVDPIFPCWNCLFCRQGQYYHCDHRMILGLDCDGAYAEYFVASAQNCHRLPMNMTWEEGASVDALACAIHAIRQVPHSWGETVAILGPGPAGLNMVSLLKRSGASKVILIGTRQAPLEIGKKYGADVVINIQSEERVVECVLAETRGIGVDLAIESCGQGLAIRHAIEIVKKRGKILIYGSFPQPLDGIDFQKMRRKEVTVFTSMGAPWTYEDAIDLIFTGQVPVLEIITHRFLLDELDKAFEVMETDRSNYVKGVIKQA